MDGAYSSLQILELSPAWERGLLHFLNDLKAVGDDLLFSPHPVDEHSVQRIAARHGKDKYYVLVEEGRVLGYGMLRGWDEGYRVPSLGVAIHPSARGQRLGRLLMDFLHMVAHRSGAERVRLRVRKENEGALKLYQCLGYSFEPDPNQAGFLVGFKELVRN